MPKKPTNQRTLRETKTVWASTGDVTFQDSEKLNRGEGQCHMINEFGHCITLPEPAELKAALKELKKEGFSRRLQALVKRATLEGAQHLRLDCDEDPVGKIDPSWENQPILKMPHGNSNP